MKKQWAVIGLVGAAVVTLVWLKTTVSRPAGVGSTAAAPGSTQAKVLLFADLREAGSKCGCAEIIRIVRAAGEMPGFITQEYDSRGPTEQARLFGVRVLPTVVIAEPDGSERARFEGESPETIAALQAFFRETTADTPGRQQTR